MSSRLRWIAAVVSLCVPAVAVAVSWIAWSGALSDRVASHWSGTGPADDSLPTTGVFAFTLAITAAAALAAIIVTLLPGIPQRAKRAALFWIGMPAGLAATVWLIPAWLTLQAGSPEDAVLGLWVLPLGACALYGAIPYAIAPRPPVATPVRVAPLPLGESDVSAWSRTITVNIFIWATVVVLALSVAVYVPITISGDLTSGAFGLVIMIVAAAVTASFIRLHVTVDRRGLRVTSRVFGIPLKRIPLDKVETVEATDIRPSEWGGWGYRVMPGRSALVLRGGPALVVTTTDGKQFAITLDEPETPAALLSALSGRHEPTNSNALDP